MKNIILLLMLIPLANCLTIGEGVVIKVNESSSGEYVINSTVYLDNLTFNETHAIFSGLDTQNQSCYDVDTLEFLCENGSVCPLNQTDIDRNIIFSSPTIYTYSVDYVLGPAVNFIRFINVSPDWITLITPPEGQTDDLGIINATNDGNIEAKLQIRITNELNDNWTIMANSTAITDLINITTEWVDITTTVAINEMKQIWLWANASFVHYTPGAGIEMQAVVA